MDIYNYNIKFKFFYVIHCSASLIYDLQLPVSMLLCGWEAIPDIGLSERSELGVISVTIHKTDDDLETIYV